MRQSFIIEKISKYEKGTTSPLSAKSLAGIARLMNTLTMKDKLYVATNMNLKSFEYMTCGMNRGVDNIILENSADMKRTIVVYQIGK